MEITKITERMKSTFTHSTYPTFEEYLSFCTAWCLGVASSVSTQLSFSRELKIEHKFF